MQSGVPGKVLRPLLLRLQHAFDALALLAESFGGNGQGREVGAFELFVGRNGPYAQAGQLCDRPHNCPIFLLSPTLSFMGMGFLLEGEVS